MNKTDGELKQIIDKTKNNKAQNKGSHDILINQILKHVKENNNSDFRVINSNIFQLKKLRYKADYDDISIGFSDSSNSLQLADKMIPVLKKY